jgi:soluble P-type ATPase
MIELVIPGFGNLNLKYLVLDFNGTLATDGVIVDGILDMLNILSKQVDIHILTADTYGTVSSQLDQHPFQVTVVPTSKQDQFKAEYVKRLGQAHVACVGNGRNDRLMMRETALAIAVIQREGAASETVAAAHIVCTNILDALSLLVNTKRIAATLRN